MKQCVIMAFCGMLSAISAAQQTQPRVPQIGYLYPAGGQCGTVVQLIAGGQNLRAPTDVHLTGDGVEVRIVRYFPPARTLDRDQRQELWRRIEAARDGQPVEPPQTADDSDATASVARLPDHLLWYDLESKSLAELAHVAWTVSIPRTKLQPNRQLAESVLIEVTIAPNAEPGDRELRLVTATGITNPMIFQIGRLPEVYEREPNNGASANVRGFPELPKAAPLELPVLINGQIMPGDVDRFRFVAERGADLVIDAQARRLIPYLADAVPGWFQAVITLYDADGNEAAFADNYRFDSDPVLFYTIPETGIYELEIRDAIYRGREDFIYRIAIGQLPFITQMFPLGGRQHADSIATIDGWNLPTSTLSLETRPGDPIRQTAWQNRTERSNTILYAVDTLPELNEVEPNDSLASAQPITLPAIINGRIDAPQDTDVFGFDGRAGQTIAVEVYARRLHSPLDSLVRLTDAKGNLLAWNDDYVVSDNFLFMESTGTLTHHADSYVMAVLPEDGRYFVHLTDVQSQGGPDVGYRLRISPARPDFDLRMTPSSLSLRPGQPTEFTVYVLSKDGFDGEIEIVLKDAPSGFTLQNNRIAAGSGAAQMSLTAPRQFHNRPLSLRLEGRATIDGRLVSRPVIAADERMQAFLYRHLVPAQELVVAVQRQRRPAQANR